MGAVNRYISETVQYDPSSLKLGMFSAIEGIVEIGKNVKIGNQVTISSEKSRIKIGDNVEISAGCIIMPDDFGDEGGLEIVIGEGTKLKRKVCLEGDVVLGAGCKLGIGTVIGKHCRIGDGCDFRQYVTIAKNTTMRTKNIVYPFTDIGSAPQGQHYENEGTSVEIGDNNLIRELSTINRGSVEMGDKTGVTRIGNFNKIYSQVHIAHDCQIGNYNEIVSLTGLAGHVHIGNHVRVSGEVGIAQFVHVGDYSMIGGASKVVTNVLPYSIVDGRPAIHRMINKKRIGIVFGESGRNVLQAVKQAYDNVLENKALKDADVVVKLKEIGTPQAVEIADFIEKLHPKNTLLERGLRDFRQE